MSKTAIIAGATGAVGSWLVKELIAHPEFTTIYTLVRRENAVPSDPKVREILLTGDNTVDFANLPVVDVVFSAAGTTIKQAGSNEAFRKVDFDFNADLASAARKLGVPQFHLVSSVGADSTSSFFYLKVKGEIEDHINKLAFPHGVIYRPGVLSDANRPKMRIGESFASCVMGAIAFVLPFGAIARSGPIAVHDVAKGMIDDAVEFANKPAEAEAAAVPDAEAGVPGDAQAAPADQWVVYNGSAVITKRVKASTKRAADEAAAIAAAPKTPKTYAAAVAEGAHPEGEVAHDAGAAKPDASA